MDKKEEIKKQIFELTSDYFKLAHAPKKFVKGLSNVPVSGKSFDEKELQLIVESALDGWFTTGRFNKEFEIRLAEYIGVKKLLTVNSGSSANLLAFAALASPVLGERAIKPGDEVITVAASFPTTINPILIYGAVPVFVDIDIPTYNIDVSKIEAAITDRTKAIMVAHTLGNPFDLEKIMELSQKYNLWVIEDCCDALGSRYKNKHVGTFGHIATLSFYPAHHITTGEGGAVFTNDNKIKKIVESIRDWGRDCWCEPGCDNTCGKRFDWQLGDLPAGYDHKYIYSQLGYNLKITDMQAALGLAQLDKLPGFVEQRKQKFKLLYEGLSKHSDKIILPEATENSNPSWFGFLITLKKDAGISRNEIVDRLNEAKIGTRLLFAGDVRKQPYFKNYYAGDVNRLPNTDMVLNNTFWIGLAPIVADDMIEYIIESFDSIFSTEKNKIYEQPILN